MQSKPLSPHLTPWSPCSIFFSLWKAFFKPELAFKWLITFDQYSACCSVSFLIERYITKTAPSNDLDDWCLLIIPPSAWDNTRRKTGSPSLSPSPKIPRAGEEKCSLGTTLKRTSVKVSSVAVTLKQWWRDVGLCPKPPPRATVSSTTKHRCRRARSMGHSLSMCKLQHCRHKKSKLPFDKNSSYARLFVTFLA